MQYYHCYIASGWFNKEQEKDLKAIKEICKELAVKFYSPMDEMQCAPDATENHKLAVFLSNIHAIESSQFIICNTRDKDMGTIFEAGVAFASGVPIIYYCSDKNVTQFNLMLAKSGICIARSPAQLARYVTQFMDEPMFSKEYTGEVE